MTCKEFDHDLALVPFGNEIKFECQNCDVILNIREVRHSEYYCSYCGMKLHPEWLEKFCSIKCALSNVGKQRKKMLRWKENNEL